MQIDVAQDAVHFRRIPPLLAALIRELPDAPVTDDPRVEARMFPDPGEGDDLCDDWQAFVAPELRDAFAGARDIVRADLETLQPDGGLFRLTFPLAHADAWLGTLNQARLALAARNGFDERDLADEIPEDIRKPRERAIFQVHFYGMLQEWLIRFLF